MSGGFRYSHRDIRKLDIRHIYSGYSRAALCLPPPVDKEGLRHLERIHDQMKHPEVPKLPGKCFEYNKEYKIILPTAPAFRRFSKPEVADLVCRLNSKRLTNTDSLDTNDINYLRAVGSAPTRKRRNVREENQLSENTKAQKSSADVDNISRRLYSARTQSALLRQREKVVLTSRDAGTVKPENKCKKKDK